MLPDLTIKSFLPANNDPIISATRSILSASDLVATQQFCPLPKGLKPRQPVFSEPGDLGETCLVSNGAHIWLVVLTILKNMKISWEDYSQYIMEKMFETTNQIFS